MTREGTPKTITMTMFLIGYDANGSEVQESITTVVPITMLDDPPFEVRYPGLPDAEPEF